MADDSLQQVYQRITSRIQEKQKQLAQIEAQISLHQRETRLAGLTKRELEGLGNSVPMYKSMGKMFVQETKADLLADLEKTTTESATMLTALEKKQKFVKRELDDATGNLRDIVMSSQAAAARAK
ncbi:Prefoldin [Linderina pennispora]|uniref:Prefoldin n=1 Tax=Linderina pennispora TaxID=61395 RepID=A0A1Y1WCV4_9FUNG|nr:Prefoldin [Linderina pennispora]ORX70974.1 Prefoldin [Linderina pennispora]